jgi:hypothetical protein
MASSRLLLVSIRVIRKSPSRMAIGARRLALHQNLPFEGEQRSQSIMVPNFYPQRMPNKNDRG